MTTLSARHPASKLSIGELSLTKAELKKLPDAHRRFLFSSELASNDLALFNSLITMCGTVTEKDEVIQAYINSRWISLIKHASATICAFVETYQSYQQQMRKFSKTKKPKTLDDLNDIKMSTYYELAKRIRNNVIAHYLNNDNNYEQYLAQFEDSHTFKSYLACMMGNNLHSIGDELSVLGPLRQCFESDYRRNTSPEDRKATDLKHLDQYCAWCSSSIGRIVTWQQEFMGWVLEKYYPEKSVSLRKHHVRPELRYTVGEYCVPIFAHR